MFSLGQGVLKSISWVTSLNVGDPEIVTCVIPASEGA